MRHKRGKPLAAKLLSGKLFVIFGNGARDIRTNQRGRVPLEFWDLAKKFVEIRPLRLGSRDDRSDGEQQKAYNSTCKYKAAAVCNGTLNVKHLNLARYLSGCGIVGSLLFWCQRDWRRWSGGSVSFGAYSDPAEVDRLEPTLERRAVGF